jgi:hypothetical protein
VVVGGWVGKGEGGREEEVAAVPSGVSIMCTTISR